MRRKKDISSNALQLISILSILLFVSRSLLAQVDIEDGPVKIYYPNGQVSSEGTIKDGKPDGFWKTYYVTGIIKSQGKRTNYLLDSTWNFYNLAGDVIEQINYQLGVRSGYSFKYIYDNPNLPGVKTLISKELYINDKKEGNSYYYYNTGELRESVYFSNGKRQGNAREYDKDSTVITVLQYNNNYLVSRERINRKDNFGRKQGTYKEFHEDGSLKKEKNFLDDELHGYFREFDKTGELLQAMRYERGAIIEEIDEEAREIIDFKRTYDEQGRIVFSGAYFEDVPRGIHRFFDTSGTVVNSFIYNELGQRISEGIVNEQGRRVGKWIDYYVSGKVKAVGSYRNNRKNGNWVYYFENNIIEQKGSFINGRLNGEWIWYYPDGSIWRQESFFNGNEDGHSVEYDSDQNVLSEGVYVDGEKDGDWTYKVGDHQEEGAYIIGLREGKWIYYHGDGSMKFEGNYLQGNPDGKQMYYYPSGAIKEEQYFKKGIRQKIWRKYDEEGNILLAITYKDNQEFRINGIKINLPESEIKLIE